MTTKKDYIVIAKIIKEAKKSVYPAEKIAIELSKYFEKDNPKFDRKRFIEATETQK